LLKGKKGVPPMGRQGHMPKAKCEAVLLGVAAGWFTQDPDCKAGGEIIGSRKEAIGV